MIRGLVPSRSETPLGSPALLLAAAVAVSLCTVMDPAAGATLATGPGSARIVSASDRQALGRLLHELSIAARKVGLWRNTELLLSHHGCPAAHPGPDLQALRLQRCHAQVREHHVGGLPAVLVRPHLIDLPPPAC